MTEAVAAVATETPVVATPETKIEIPAAAPAPAVAEQPKIETTATGLPVASYDPSGDPGADIALEWIGKLGVGQNHTAMQEAFKGNFGPLEDLLKSLGDKATGYEKYVGLGKKAFEDAKKTAEQGQATINKAVFTAAGGEAEWKAIQEWAGKTADPAEKAEINAMLKAGPTQARAAVQMLKNLYQAASGTVIKPQSAVKPDASGLSGAAPVAMSRREYTDAVASLSRKFGGQLEGNPEYNQLNARYLAGRKQ